MKYDVVYIGGGPGGYVGAIMAASLGLKVALVEKEQVGGTCLTKGCIPTKTLIAGSDIVHALSKASDFGIKIDGFSIDYNAMKLRKDQVVKKLWQGVTNLVKSHGITLIEGTASFISPRELKIMGKKSEIIEADHFVIATGSVSSTIASAPIDYHLIHDSTSILEMTKLPKKMVVLGGGYIGCEFASLFNQLGVEVHIVEFLPGIVLTQGKSVSSFLTKAFEKSGIKLKCSVKMEKCEKSEKGVKLSLSDGSTLEADILLISVGRKAYTEGLNLVAAGVPVDASGFIPVNEYMETSVSGIYAIGDVTGKAMLAHVASHQGIAVAKTISGKRTSVDYNTIPAVIFTHPEIATVGLTLEKAKESGFSAASSAMFPFAALGKALASGDFEGYAEIVYDIKTTQILGGAIVGHDAGNLISEITLAMQNELTLECITNTIHPHPTLSEALAEAAELALGHPLHLPKKSS